MELWFIYSLLSALFVWFFSFSSKLSVEKNHNPSLVIFYAMFSASLCAIIWLFFSEIVDYWKIYISMFYWFLNWAFYVITTITRMQSLKFIDTSIYFPIYKAISPISLIIIMILFFWEILNSNQIIWVLLWIMVPLILIWINKKSNKNKKWYYYLFLWLIWALLASISAKLAIQNWVNISIYILVSLLTWTLFSFILFFKNIKKEFKYSVLHIRKTAIITWILHFLWFYFFVKAIELWNNISVAYIVQSLYIIIPIILAVIFYKEQFDYKKFIAILLTILSILFLK